MGTTSKAANLQEFCSIICQAPAVQVQAHAYAVDYVENLCPVAAEF